MSFVTEFMTPILGLANVFIALFILIFAYIFLRHTEPEEGRKPWKYLFAAVFFFFLFEVITAFDFFNLHILPEVKDVLKTFFIAIVLYVFVYQHNLIMKSNRILINRKVTVEEKILKKNPKKKSK